MKLELSGSNVSDNGGMETARWRSKEGRAEPQPKLIMKAKLSMARADKPDNQ